MVARCKISWKKRKKDMTLRVTSKCDVFYSGNHYRRPTQHLKAWYSTNQEKDRLYNFILGTHLYHFNMDSYFTHFQVQI